MCNLTNNVILCGTHGCGKTTLQNKYTSLDGIRVVLFQEAIRLASQLSNCTFLPYECEQKTIKYKSSLDGDSVFIRTLTPTNKITEDSLKRYINAELFLVTYYSTVVNMLDEYRQIHKSKLFLFDRFIVDVLFYLEFFKNSYYEYLMEYNLINTIDSVYNKCSDVVLKFKSTSHYKQTLFILLEPLNYNEAEDKFRLPKSTQLPVYKIAQRTLKELDINYTSLTSAQAEHLLNYNLYNLHHNKRDS